MAFNFVLVLCAAAVFSMAVAMPTETAPQQTNVAPKEDMKTAETHYWPIGLNLGLGGYSRSYMPFSTYKGLGIDIGLSPYRSYYYGAGYPYYY